MGKELWEERLCSWFERRETWQDWIMKRLIRVGKARLTHCKY